MLIPETLTSIKDCLIEPCDAAEEIPSSIKVWLKECLDNDDSYTDRSKLWKWVDEVTIDKLVMFFHELTSKLQDINLYVVEHNAIVSYCTGSHNNAMPLGSLEQAKGAMFYITPYIAKNKVALSQCLTILQKAREDVAMNPSKAKDSGTALRTIQHVLTRTLNKLNCLIEVSDYQVAASLLNLPSEITSESFAFVKPTACIAFREYMESKENEEVEIDRLMEQLNDQYDELNRQQGNAAQGNSAEDDGSSSNADEQNDDHHHMPASSTVDTIENMDELYRDLGHVPVYAVEKIGTKTVYQAIPTPRHYENRGEALRKLNRYEYCALTHLVKRDLKEKPPCKTTRPAATKFLFPERYILHASKAQMLNAKQKTVVFCDKQPHHPGPEPDDNNSVEHGRWKLRADVFARYMLFMYRPEVDFFDETDRPTLTPLTYDWHALQQWVFTCQHDDSIISKFRLQSLNNRIYGLTAEFANKAILSDYRGRNRTLWNESQIAEFNKEDAQLRRHAVQHDALELPDHWFEENQHDLGVPQTKQMEIQLEDNYVQLSVLQNICRVVDQRNRARFETFTNVVDSIKAGICDLDLHVVRQKAKLLLEAKQCPVVPKGQSSPLGQSSQHMEALLNEVCIKHKDNQKQYHLIYEKYFLDVRDRPPGVVLLHGAAGTGKSHVIKGITDAARICGKRTLNTSFNAINALAIGGPTFASLVHLSGSHKHEVRSFEKSWQIREFVDDVRIQEVDLIIIDEISNIAPWHLARLNAVCQQTRNNYTADFGGIPVLMVGDLNQLPPVRAGKSLTQAALAIAKHDRQQLLAETDATTRIRMHTEQALHSERMAEFADDSPTRKGTELFTKAVLCQLDEQVRADKSDPEHVSFVSRLSQGKSIAVNDLQQYELLSKSDFETEDSPWLTAPVIVATNREKHTLTHHRCVWYAKSKGLPVIRWRTHYRGWQQKPTNPRHLEEAMSDPCFFEYFVRMANGSITAHVNKELNIVNATPVQYHSIVPVDDNQKQELETALANAVPGDVITLSRPPAAVNVILRVDSQSDDERDAWSDYTVVQKRVIVPILPGAHRTITTEEKKETSQQTKTLVPGGLLYRPSKVQIVSHFPLELQFVITAHKAQGRTLDNVILALSERHAKGCNMSYAAIYVALSRVKFRNNIRLLLASDKPLVWESLLYLERLKPEKSIKAFFEGYRHNNQQWDSDIALDAFANS